MSYAQKLAAAIIKAMEESYQQANGPGGFYVYDNDPEDAGIDGRDNLVKIVERALLLVSSRNGDLTFTD